MNDGGAYAIYHSSLAMLSQGIDVKILAMDLLKSREDNIVIPADFIARTKFESVTVDNRIRPLKALKNLAGKTSYFVDRFYSEAYSKKLAEILMNETFGIIHLEHLYVCLYLDVIRKYSNARVVLRAQNVEHQLWKDNLAMIRNPFVKLFISVAAKRLTHFENEVIKHMDGIMALSEEDALYFKQNTKNAHISAIPIGIDTLAYSNIDQEKQYKNFPVLFHLGSMDWKPNIIGMMWFVNKVMPLLKQKHPQIQVVIAGKNMPQWFFSKADNNLKVMGRVRDAREFQEDKAILIVPLLTGSGIRVKILEGMAMGKTIISTTIGAKGIDYEKDKTILIADTPAEFAEQISKCIASEELCRETGRRAQLLVREQYAINSIGEKMLLFYNDLLRR